MGNHVSQHVWANFGTGKVLAHLEDTGHEVAGADGPETKFWVQNPVNGKAEELGYREPSGPDSDTGRTWWHI